MSQFTSAIVCCLGGELWSFLSTFFLTVEKEVLEHAKVKLPVTYVLRKENGMILT
jgi:hypothetical protein